ncbi:MAG: S46 family peptidase [Rhodothermaceae bacterium]|nr:S46 family peptidase [Rhodothermaceae bacterium]MXZ17337.1 S46 family peptidase [Rhodothermaceae bacterium]MXZ58416.1 S46 family peptidase [Rhodothermaceae bacterium]MYB90121.1 S46 family peptidase [Rhodothermaceae bacterium]MYD67117.1 S46 family peptidase [Rhodothermaceae bacterium]
MKNSSIVCGIISLLLLMPSAQAKQMSTSGEADTVVVRHQWYSQAHLEAPGSHIVDKDWIENVRLGTLQLPQCAGALVSADGLAVTSAACLRSLETWIRPTDSVFVADELLQERRLAGLAVEQLVEVRKLDSPEDPPSDALPRTRTEIVAADDSSSFWEYTWRIYDDVRLVLIPPVEVANFGNEEGVYPRYALDFALFRVYDESGQSLDTENYFAWSDRPPDHREKLFATAVDENGPFTSVTLSNTFTYNGTVSPPYTTLYGMLDLHHSHGAIGVWGLPAGWIAGIKESDLSAALNFSVAGKCAQIGTGIVDIDLEILGIAFDHAFTGGRERCVAVSTSGILSLLRTVFEAENIVEELAEQARSAEENG